MSSHPDLLPHLVLCFVAARARIGVRGLMRRFGISRERAVFLLEALTDRGVLFYGRRGGYCTHRDAWPWLMLAISDPWAPVAPGAYRWYRKQRSALPVTDSDQRKV